MAKDRDVIYVKVAVSYGKPTEMDNEGCDGLFIESTKVCTKEVTQLKAEVEDLRKAGDELVSRVEQFTDEWSEDAWPFLDLATSKMNDALLTGGKS